MTSRLFVLGTLITALAAATPLTVTISGTGSGSFGDKTFTAAQFAVTLTADSAAAAKPPCCNSLELPAGSPATVTVQGLGTATIMDTQTIFVNPGSGAI